MTAPDHYELWGHERIKESLAREPVHVQQAVLAAIAAIVESPYDPEGVKTFKARGRAATVYRTCWFAILPHGFRMSFDVADRAAPASFGVVKVLALLRELIGDQPPPNFD